MKLTVTSPYTSKDQRKADMANKFIGRGSPRSSTAQYAKDYGDMANCGIYSKADIVFVSAEGGRTGRLDPDFEELQRALDAGATIITDTPQHRSRPYNVGERQVVQYLSAHCYSETRPGVWT